MANINNINTENTWLDVETVAKLKNISRRGVRLSLNQDRYEYKVEKVKGGKTYKVRLSSLEEEYQINSIFIKWSVIQRATSAILQGNSSISIP